MIEDDRIAWLTLGMIPRVGGKVLAALLDTFGTPSNVLEADRTALLAVPGIGNKTAESILAADTGTTEHNLASWQRSGITVLDWHDKRYPQRLQSLDDRPPVLFALGSWATDNTPIIAVVGTRNPSKPAQILAARLSYQLAEAGWTVVSGLALGIDTAAHQGVLATRNPDYITHAVVGCGVDVVYPAENRALRNRMLAEGGAIFSEVAPGVAPAPSLLVARNRLITGLAQVVVVVESTIEGGAMHAARFAEQQQRDIWTVNYPHATGNQQLIRNGSKIIPTWPNGIQQFVESISQTQR